MSDLSNLIFHNAKNYISSPFGNRRVLNTSAGKTSSFHSGVDYATYGVKLPQYAIENGTVLTAGRASDGANYVWVSYPRLGVKMLHYHLDSIKVKSGQSVNKSTIIGYTGRTGKATGIHLHLGLKKLSGGGFIDPESWFKNSYKAATSTVKTPEKESNGFFPPRGYFKKGDVSDNVGKIAAFMYNTFPSYTSKKALGNTYGDNLIAAVKEFQKRTGLTADGYFGEKTLKKLESFGFKK